MIRDVRDKPVEVSMPDMPKELLKTSSRIQQSKTQQRSITPVTYIYFANNTGKINADFQDSGEVRVRYSQRGKTMWTTFSIILDRKRNITDMLKVRA